MTRTARPFPLHPRLTGPAGPATLTDMGSVHATCVAVDGVGVMLRGPSGSGKSDLALRLIDGGAQLVSDDQVRLSKGAGDDAGRLIARAPAAIVGLLEVRGIGLLPVPCVASVPVALVVDLKPGGEIDRMPEPASCAYLGIPLPLIALDPFRPSAPAALRLALAAIRDSAGQWPQAEGL